MSSRARIRRPDALFAWIAALPWIEPLLSVAPIPNGFEAILITVISVPLVVGTLVVGCVAVVRAAQGWREVSLLALAAITLAMAALVVAADGFGAISFGTAGWGYRIGSVAMAVILVARAVDATRIRRRGTGLAI